MTGMNDCYYTMTPPQWQSDANSKSHLVCYKGISMYVQPYDARHYQIVSLCTTNPAYYLDKTLTPGSLIPIFS